MGKWDKVGQKSAFFEAAVTIYVTFVKDQGVQRMFTLSLQVYHACQEVFLIPFRITLFKLCYDGNECREGGSAADNGFA